METEIIKTDDPNIIIARTIEDRVINIEEKTIQIESLKQYRLELIEQRDIIFNEKASITNSIIQDLVNIKLIDLNNEIINLEYTIQNLITTITI